MSGSAMDDRLLGIYLNDHLAGATAGLELSRRLASRNRATAHADRLRRVASEIEEDRETLSSVMARLGVPPNPLKTVAARAAERMGRFKLNGRLLSYSPLSRLEELEALCIGVEGKAALWRSLKESRGADPRLEGIDWDDLLRRAGRQREELEAMRVQAAAGTFGVASTGPRTRR